MNDYKELIEDKTVKIEIVKGCEGFCICVDDYRICGNKPWGGGTVVKSWDVKLSELLEASKANKIIEQLVKERDAAVRDITELLAQADIFYKCWACGKYHNANYTDCEQISNDCFSRCEQAEWRGVTDDNQTIRSDNAQADTADCAA